MSVKIALAGNPNCGKTTLFNFLTGANQYVGNWPGVTVEKKEGKLKGNSEVVIQDLPGIYSLSPYSPEEVVSRTYLVQEHPDAILNIIDGTNIERNLYLTTQLLELGHPVVLAVNMIDLVRKNGDEIDLEKLGKALRCTCVEISALKGEGAQDAAQKAVYLGLLILNDTEDKLLFIKKAKFMAQIIFDGSNKPLCVVLTGTIAAGAATDAFGICEISTPQGGNT